MVEGRGGKAAVFALVCVLAALIAVGVIYYNKVYTPALEEAATESTNYSPQKNTPQKAGKRTLIASDSKNDIELYKDGDFVIIVHNGEESEYTGWAETFGSTETDLYYDDYNSDGLDDIIILDTEREDSDTGQPFYGFYVLAAKETGGKISYNVNYTNSADWKNMFNNIVNCYLNQPKAYPQLLQFAMGYSGAGVSVDSDPGLVTNDQRAWYITVPRDKNGRYYTLDSLSTGSAVMEYDAAAGTAASHINIYAVYSNGEEQLIGTVASGISLVEDGFTIKTRSVIFEPEDGLEARAPQE